MNRRVLVIIAVGFVVIAAAAIALFPTRRPSESHDIAKDVTKPPPPGTPSPTPPGADAPVSAPDNAARSARRRAAPKPEPSSASEAAAPVEAPPALGVLRIDSDVPGAQVFIDREYVGATPVTATGVKPGSHRINVSAQGYEGFAETIDVAPGPRDFTIAFKEVRLDTAVDVVHKHRMGSCKGRLIATARGVRYETTNKDDGFSTALLDIGTFQVDYLDKNLRLILRNGKRYDFTDPEGNADHLFVFHRDVEKARERLKKGDRPAQ